MVNRPLENRGKNRYAPQHQFGDVVRVVDVVVTRNTSHRFQSFSAISLLVMLDPVDDYSRSRSSCTSAVLM